MDVTAFGLGRENDIYAKEIHSRGLGGTDLDVYKRQALVLSIAAVSFVATTLIPSCLSLIHISALKGAIRRNVKILLRFIR